MEILKRTLKSYLIIIFLFLILSILLAALIAFTGFKEEWIFTALVVILSMVSMGIGVLEGNIFAKRGILIGMAAAILLILIIICAIGGVFAESFSKDSFTPFYIIPVIAGGIGGIIGANLNK